jgi:hypothetical protein
VPYWAFFTESLGKGDGNTVPLVAVGTGAFEADRVQPDIARTTLMATPKIIHIFLLI